MRGASASLEPRSWSQTPKPAAWRRGPRLPDSQPVRGREQERATGLGWLEGEHALVLQPRPPPRPPPGHRAATPLGFVLRSVLGGRAACQSQGASHESWWCVSGSFCCS